MSRYNRVCFWLLVQIGFALQCHAEAQPANVVQKPAMPIYGLAPPPPELPPVYYQHFKVPEPSQWLKTEVVQTSGQELRDVYQRLLTQQLIESIPKSETGISTDNAGEINRIREGKELAARTAQQGFLQSYDFFFEGDTAYWKFYGLATMPEPLRLLHISFSDPAHYVMKLTVQCQTIDESCKALSQHASERRLPPPPASHSAQAKMEWLHIRSQQPCIEPGPISMKYPVLPTGSSLDISTLTVKVRYVSDACGYPLSLRVLESSKYPDMDKLALDTLWLWRAKLPENRISIESGKLRQFDIPVKFVRPAN